MADVSTSRRERRPRAVRSGCAALAIMVACAGPAQAICASSLDQSSLEDIIDDPKSLLRLNPRGGEPLMAAIRRLAVNGTRILKTIGTLVPQANAQQKDAIGQGLARASGACSARSPEITRQISDLVRTSGDRDVTRAYVRFFSATDDRTNNYNTTPAINPEQGSGRRMPNLESGFSPKGLPLGDPFAKP